MIEIVYTTNSSLWNCHIVNSAVGLVLEQTVCLHPGRERESQLIMYKLLLNIPSCTWTCSVEDEQLQKEIRN